MNGTHYLHENEIKECSLFLLFPYHRKMEHRRHKRDETNRQKDSLKEGKGSTQKGSTYFICELYKIPGIKKIETKRTTSG